MIKLLVSIGCLSVNKCFEEGKHRGFGFIEFEFSEDAKSAIDNMHMAEFYGQIIRCNLARPTKIITAGVHSEPGIFLHLLEKVMLHL